MDLRWFVEGVESLAHARQIRHGGNKSDTEPPLENDLAQDLETLHINGSPQAWIFNFIQIYIGGFLWPET